MPRLDEPGSLFLSLYWENIRAITTSGPSLRPTPALMPEGTDGTWRRSSRMSTSSALRGRQAQADTS